jgi:serine/threonine-protein kinase
VARFAPLLTLATVAALGGGLVLVNNAVVAPPAVTGAAAAAPPAEVGAPAPAEADPHAAPGPEPAAPAVVEAAYTGRSAGNEVTVALAVKDGRAVAYVCDGKKVEAWYEGTLTGDELRLSGADGKQGIEATVTEAAALGTVTVAGDELPFAAEGVEAPAGLYEGRANVRGVLTRIGWIVDADGDVTGVANAGGTRRPAPELDPDDPAATRIDGVPITVTALDGSTPVVGR